MHQPQPLTLGEATVGSQGAIPLIVGHTEGKPPEYSMTEIWFPNGVAMGRRLQGEVPEYCRKLKWKAPANIARERSDKVENCLT